MLKINIKKNPFDIKIYKNVTLQASELLMSKILKKFTEGNGRNL